MAKPKKDSETYGEKEALERMNQALKKAMESKPTPHRDMVKGRTGKGKKKR